MERTRHARVPGTERAGTHATPDDSARRNPTLDDVARLAGVSRSTVSRVVNREGTVARAARERVEAAVRELGYHPNLAARALVKGRSEVIDLIVIDDDASTFGTNPYYPRVVTGVLTALAGTDVRMNVHVVDEPGAPALFDELADAGGLGALLVNVPPELAGPLHRRWPRLVSLGRSAPGVPFTDPDNVGGAHAAIRHLHSLGRRKVAAIYGPPRSSCAIGRRAGYLSAMREAGLDPVSASGDFCRESGLRATRQLLAEHPDIDAIFASCDLTATGVLQTLAEAGRRVPDDVAVVGFDDSLLATCTTPGLTSVRQPVEHLAATATRALLDRQVDSRWQVIMPVELAVRGSTAVAA